MAAVQRQCSVSTPKGAEGVTLYHAPYAGGAGRRVIAVSVPISLAASSVLAMELLKKRLFAWEDDLNAAFGAMDEDEDPTGSGDATTGRQQAAAAAGTTTAASVSASQPVGPQQVAPASSNAVDAAAGAVAGGAPIRPHPGPSTVPPAQGVGGAPSQPNSGGQRPTLFNLLEALASDSVTTPDQRNSIRGIVTDFLNHDLPHSKVYSFIGAVVGHDVLHTIVRKLENEPGRLGVPDAGGLARIEKAFGLSKTTNQQPTHSPQPSGSASSTTPHGVVAGGARSAVGVPQDQQQAAGGAFDGGAAGPGLSNRDAILRVIRRNLDSRRMPPQSTKDVFEKVRWLPVRRPLTPVPVFGHTLISFSNKAIFFGGTNERGEGVSFRSACVINLNFFSSRIFVFCGEYPSERDGHSTNGLTLQHSPGVILFGGLSGNHFCNDVYILELDFKRWVRKHPAGLPPAPRDQHAASVFPAKTETGNWRDSSSDNLSEFLFVFGGRTGNPSVSFHCLNDMWALHITSNTWTEVRVGDTKPPPRYGFSMIWSEDLHLSLFGGETHGANGRVSCRERVLLEDFWHFKIKDIVNEAHSGPVVVGEWQQEIYEGKIGPRSHYAAIFITQRYQEPRAEPRTIERLMLITSGVTTVMEGGRARATETDQISVYFFSKKQWYTVKPRYPADYVGEPFGARQRHVACFFETHNPLARPTRPPVPCLFIHGGFRRHQVLGDAWVLSLTGDDPYKGLMAQGGPGAVSCPVGGESLHSHLMGHGINSMRMTPSWYQRDTHTPGILWALCSQQRWLMGAIAQLIDNAMHPSVGCRNVWIKFEETPDKDPMLSVQDDGQGLDYPAMNKLLRLYGSFEPGERRRKGYEYGCGFKMAYGRIASSCAIMSRTQGTIGIGMLSLELMGHCDAREIAAPMCMWRLPNKELINRDPNNMADHRHHQRLLMTYTPFTTPSLLAEQINVLGTMPGSRMVFWDLRDDLDSLVVDSRDNMMYLSSAPGIRLPGQGRFGSSTASRSGEPGGCSSEVKMADQTSPATGASTTEAKPAETQGVPNGLASEGSGNGNDEKPQSIRDPCRPPVDEAAAANAQVGPDMLDVDEDGKPLNTPGQAGSSPAGDGNSGEGVKSEQPAEGVAERATSADVQGEQAKGQRALPPHFPLWTTARHSPDYCLATYLFWLNLHAPATIHVQGIPLSPQPLSYGGRQRESRETKGASEVAESNAESHISKEQQEAAELQAEAASGLIASISRPQTALAEKRSADGDLMADGSPLSPSLYLFLKQRLYAPVICHPAMGGHCSLRSDWKYSTHAFAADESTLSSSYFGCALMVWLCVPEQVELSYLFTPADHDAGCFALMGFLNDPTGESSQPRVCEAGVLLYFKQRLIRKLECTFPDAPKYIEASRYPPSERLFGQDGEPPQICRYAFTAVINVPEWMLPSLNKQEFLHENNKPYLKFKARCLKLMQDYLSRCRNPQALNAWIEQRTKRLSEYQDMQRRNRPKRRLNEDLTDEEQPRRSPTPPLTHSSSGAPIWTGQRGSNAGSAEDAPAAAKQVQESGGTEDAATYPNDGDVAAEDAMGATAPVKKGELGADDMAQDGTGAPASVPVASYTESEEKETKEEGGGDLSEEATVGNKAEEPWTQEVAPASDAPATE
ncbi:uncharacterized protein EMH_0007800 [Eimeria mitis]|uniref:Uncharacterized protein n=1 Tax=Eimeria mitis TaxID=44415 RepID=U6JQN4_9EIME|nr:uncharacterized protein EMH_0007800 [Eimeria mitis]CDJ27166.1 hypothetical protein, conserved [Eimeria mitis]